MSYTFDDIGIYYVCAAVKDATGTIVKSQKKIAVAAEDLYTELQASGFKAGVQGILEAVNAKGGVGPYTFKFTVKEGGSWKIIQPYGESSTCAWTPSQAGSVPVCIYIKDQAGTVFKYQKKVIVSAE